MELKPGYKETEVGVIPENWLTTPIGTLGTFSKGQGVRKNEANSGDIPCVRYGEIYTYHNDVIRSFNSWISLTVASTSKRLKSGDLLFAGSGETKEEIGKCVAFIGDENAYAGGDIVILSPTKGDSKFFGYLFNAPVVARQKASKGQGDAVVHISSNALSSITIPLPPTEAEQCAIATALSDVDALLDGLDRLIAKKRDLKQAAMQQLLTGETRLPGFEGEWEMKRLGELLTICHGKSQREVEMVDGPFPILATGGKIGTASRPLYDKPSVLIGRKGTINQPQYMDRPFWTVDTLFYSVIKGNNDAKFLYYRFLLIDWLQYNEASGVPSLNARTIESIEISCPDPKEQVAISTILSDMDAEIAALEQRRNKTKDIKQAMMQELLTGKTRLVTPQLSDGQIETASSKTKGHNWAINEAVVIATLVNNFGGADYPLGRKRYTKLSYLLHRRVEQQAEGYLKKAAGPYNPQTKYGGPEKIAKQNNYIMQHKGPKGHSGFIAADNIAQAEGYFETWYGQEVIQWLEQFRYKKNDDLEVLATVDMAAVELRTSGKSVDVAAVKDVIASHLEWEAKLERDAFSDANIAGAIKQIEALMESESVGGSHV